MRTNNNNVIVYLVDGSVHRYTAQAVPEIDFACNGTIIIYSHWGIQVAVDDIEEGYDELVSYDETEVAAIYFYKWDYQYTTGISYKWQPQFINDRGLMLPPMEEVALWYQTEDAMVQSFFDDEPWTQEEELIEPSFYLV